MTSSLSETAYVVGGIPATVYGMKELRGSETGLAVTYLLHGRGGSAGEDRFKRYVGALYSSITAAAAGNPKSKDILFVLFDQRNHGARIHDAERNLTWKEADKTNPTHAIDMYSTYVGTAQDVSFLTDHLPYFLFPNAEHTVTDWFIIGVSLGGHAAWQVLAQDPRITIGVPIIGTPNFIRLIKDRAKTSGVDFAPPYIPRLFLDHVEKNLPDHTSMLAFKNKHILALGGELDNLVNFKIGGSDLFVDKLKNNGVDADYWIAPGVGHTVSPEMLSKTAAFIFEKGLHVADDA